MGALSRPPPPLLYIYVCVYVYVYNNVCVCIHLYMCTYTYTDSSEWMNPSAPYTRGLDTRSLAQHMIYSERNAVKNWPPWSQVERTHFCVELILYRTYSIENTTDLPEAVLKWTLCTQKVRWKKKNLERLLSGENTLISPLRSRDALRPPCLRQFSCWESLMPYIYYIYIYVYIYHVKCVCVPTYVHIYMNVCVYYIFPPPPWVWWVEPLPLSPHTCM